MRRDTLQPAAIALSLACGLSSACGRLGFESSNAAIDRVPGTSEGEPDAGGDGHAGDGDDPTDPEDAGRQGRDAAASADASVDHDAAVPPPPPEDAGQDAGDVVIDADAGPMGVPYPLPSPLRCADYTGLVACDDFSGSRGGRTVVAASSSGSELTIAGGFATARITQSESRAAVQSSFSAITSGELYLRFSLYLPGDLALDGLNIAGFGELATGGDFGLDLNLEGDSVELYTTGDGVVTRVQHTMPRDRWTCVLLKVENVDSQSGLVRVLIDGSEILSANGVDAEPPNGITGAAAGIDWAYLEQAESTLFVDNFLVTRDHPGDCP